MLKENAERFKRNNPERSREIARHSKHNYNQRLFEIKISLQQRLGGVCVKCREDDPRVLDFDHVDPQTKKFSIVSKLTLPFSLLVVEVDKCQLLCANCHRVKTIENGDYQTRRSN